MTISSFKRLTLSYKIALLFCGVLLLIMSTFWISVEREKRLNLQLQADEVGNTLATQTADAIRELILANDLLGLNVVVGQLVETASIGQITVFDVDQEILTRAGNAPANTFYSTIYQADISLQDAVAGSVQLELDLSQLVTNLNGSRYYFWSILLFGLLLTISLSLALASYITGPINQLITALENPDEAALAEPTGSDEISRLQKACKLLLDKYQENRDYQLNLGGMLKPATTHELTRSRKIMASLLVVKVVNVHTAIELLHPNTFSRLLNEYHQYLRQAAKIYGGSLHRYTGESITVSFDSHRCGEDHSLNSICCGQLFLALMKKIYQRHKNEKGQALQFRLAIHSGETFFNVESESEVLLGKSLETVYFLSKQSKPGQLLISESTFSQVSTEHQLQHAGSIEITIPTDNISFTAYIISDENSAYSQLITKQCQHILPEAD
jgi:membrane protein